MNSAFIISSKRSNCSRVLWNVVKSTQFTWNERRRNCDRVLPLTPTTFDSVVLFPSTLIILHTRTPAFFTCSTMRWLSNLLWRKKNVRESRPTMLSDLGAYIVPVEVWMVLISQLDNNVASPSFFLFPQSITKHNNVKNLLNATWLYGFAFCCTTRTSII